MIAVIPVGGATEQRNPYIAGNPVSGEAMFFGRDDVFDFVRRALAGQHRDNVIVLYGQRRSGKTSVLYQMARRLGERHVCVFVDLHGLALNGLNGFLWELANHIARSLRREHDLTLTLPPRDEFQADARSAFTDVFLEQVWTVLGERQLLLMIDEAIRLQEQVSAGKLEPEVFEYLRHLMQHYERLSFLFSLGSGLQEMESDYSFLFNVSLYRRISFLERDDARALITQPVEGRYEVRPDAVERILEVTSGHPYYVQLVCHSLFNRWQRVNTDHVRSADVDAVLDEVVERGLAVLKHVWEESTPAEKACMAGLAAASGDHNRPHDRQAIARAWQAEGVELPAGETAQAVRSLIARDILVGDDKYAFTVELQRLWVRKFRRLEWVKEEITDAVARWATAASTGLAARSQSLSPIAVLAIALVVLAMAGAVVALVIRQSKSQDETAAAYATAQAGDVLQMATLTAVSATAAAGGRVADAALTAVAVAQAESSRDRATRTALESEKVQLVAAAATSVASIPMVPLPTPTSPPVTTAAPTAATARTPQPTAPPPLTLLPLTPPVVCEPSGQRVILPRAHASLEVDVATSPNTYGPRRSTMGIIIHATRGSATNNNLEAEYVGNVRFMLQRNTASSQVVVGPTHVCRLLQDDQTAWHAGNLDYTHLGLHIAQPNANVEFTEFEYQAAAAIVREWCTRYDLPMVHVTSDQQRGIIGASETGRGKSLGISDPGNLFDWDRFIDLVNHPA